MRILALMGSSYLSIDKLVSLALTNNAFSKEGVPKNPLALLLNASGSFGIPTKFFSSLLFKFTPR